MDKQVKTIEKLAIPSNSFNSNNMSINNIKVVKVRRTREGTQSYNNRMPKVYSYNRQKTIERDM